MPSVSRFAAWAAKVQRKSDIMAEFSRNLTFLRLFWFSCRLLALENILRARLRKACLVAIFTLLVEQLWQRVLQGFVVVLTVTEHVDGRLNSLAQRIGVCPTLSGNVIGRSMIGRRTYDG